MSLPKAIICDLDGTLCNQSHRAHLFLKRNWDEYFAGIPNDMPNEWCEKILFAAQARILGNPDAGYHDHILFVTGRPEKYRDETKKWLVNKISWIRGWWDGYLFMRRDYLDEATTSANGVTSSRPDNRNSCDVKREIYETHIKDKYDVLFVLEDDHKCAKMYRELGLTVLLCK